jgi:hypothetical protein
VRSGVTPDACGIPDGEVRRNIPRNLSLRLPVPAENLIRGGAFHRIGRAILDAGCPETAGRARPIRVSVGRGAGRRGPVPPPAVPATTIKRYAPVSRRRDHSRRALRRSLWIPDHPVV